jgi:hypothetical protein
MGRANDILTRLKTLEGDFLRFKKELDELQAVFNDLNRADNQVLSRAARILKQLTEEDADDHGIPISANRPRAEKEFRRMFGRDRDDGDKKSTQTPKQKQPQPPTTVEAQPTVGDVVTGIEQSLQSPGVMRHT